MSVEGLVILSVLANFVPAPRTLPSAQMANFGASKPAVGLGCEDWTAQERPAEWETRLRCYQLAEVETPGVDH